MKDLPKIKVLIFLQYRKQLFLCQEIFAAIIKKS